MMKAEELYYRGYNCAQSVVAAYSERLGLDVTAALKLAAGMGGGMGGLRGKCGAVTGMFLLAGLRYGDYQPGDLAAKTALYDLIKRMNADFEREFSSTVCRELLEQAKVNVSAQPSARTEAYYRERPCGRLIAEAGRIVERYLFSGENSQDK